MSRNAAPERKPQCVEAIRKQIDQVGVDALDLGPVYAEFPEIPRSTIWRWAELEKSKTPSARDLTKAYQAIEERVENGVVDHLPAMPSPASVARGGDAAIRRLDFGAEIPKLYADAEMLRAFSVKEMVDEQGKPVEKIRNPVAFEKSIKARASLIETSLKVLQEIWDMRAMQHFYELIVDEIGKEAPDAQRRILERLAALNQRHGMTMSMRI